MGALHAGHIALVDEARERAPTGWSRRSSSIRCSSAPTRISTAIRGRKRPTATMLEAAGCDLLWLPSAAEIYPDGFRDHGQRVRGQRALGRRGAAGAFRRGGDGGRQAVHRGPARCRLVRRKGFPATGGDPADGCRPWAWRRDRRGADGARRRRLGAVVAQCLSQRPRSGSARWRCRRRWSRRGAAILDGKPVARRARCGEAQL